MAGIEFKRGESNRETICDVHRDVYRGIKNSSEISQEDKEYLLERIETAFKMGKSMDAKLRQYKHNYDDNWWQKEKRAWDWSELKGEE